GPLLVLAGPGSGKTRVITRRIARLIDKGVDQREILAITFTNKAAGEMAARVESLIPGARVGVSTFHSFCAKLLRSRGEAVGLKSNFTIYDVDDQQKLMKQVLDDLDIDATHYSPRKLLHRIGEAKNELVLAEAFATRFDERVGDHIEAVVAKVYPAYQRALLAANACDFDDLLLHVVTLFHDSPDVRQTLDHAFRYVLVDEYQDTNRAQYAIVRGLSVDEPNLCVTGDPDQSIYGWRGARIANILSFERDYPGAKVVRLEENFRSDATILAAADELIAHNVHRKAKKLVGTGDDGVPVRRVVTADGRSEADTIADEIEQTVTEENASYDDFAIFYRVNALSREVERALSRKKIPYQVAAGTAFYDRMEVKDVLGYLRLIANPDDVVAFARVVNRPKRAIGDKSQRALLSFATTEGVDPVEACVRAGDVPGLAKRAVGQARQFGELMRTLEQDATGPVAHLMTLAVEKSGYLASLEQGDSEENLQRVANVEELISAAAEYDREHKAADDGSLEGFLEQASLTADVDGFDASSGQVTLMTLHAAKGLEFPHVYVVGVEQMLLPHERALKAHVIDDLEEERRLLFVGITRAEKKLTLTHAIKRTLRGKPQMTVPSEFLGEIPSLELVDLVRVTQAFTPWENPTASNPFSGGLPPRADVIERFDDRFADEQGEDPASDDADVSFDPETFSDGPEPEPTKPAPVGLAALKTGADLLAANHAVSPSDTGGLSVGVAVEHPSYGRGEVTKLSGPPRRRHVSVRFDGEEEPRTFIAAKSPLRIVS
ncbi:MAG: UvrD-helicase domain-containing protein, partial [Planctomycetota bacterium]